MIFLQRTWGKAKGVYRGILRLCRIGLKRWLLVIVSACRAGRLSVPHTGYIGDVDIPKRVIDGKEGGEEK